MVLVLSDLVRAIAIVRRGFGGGVVVAVGRGFVGSLLTTFGGGFVEAFEVVVDGRSGDPTEVVVESLADTVRMTVRGLGGEEKYPIVGHGVVGGFPFGMVVVIGCFVVVGGYSGRPLWLVEGACSSCPFWVVVEGLAGTMRMTVGGLGGEEKYPIVGHGVVGSVAVGGYSARPL